MFACGYPSWTGIGSQLHDRDSDGGEVSAGRRDRIAEDQSNPASECEQVGNEFPVEPMAYAAHSGRVRTWRPSEAIARVS